MLTPSTMLVEIAPAPYTKTGIYKGNTSKETKTPPPRKPSVNAAAIAPNILSTGVPINNTNIITKIEYVGRL